MEAELVRTGNPYYLDIPASDGATKSVVINGITLKAEPINGVARVDISSIGRTLYKDEVEAKYDAETTNEGFQKDHNLCADATMVINNETTNLCFVRVAHKYNDMSSVQTQGINSLFDTWRIYEGFPFVFTFVDSYLRDKMLYVYGRTFGKGANTGHNGIFLSDTDMSQVPDGRHVMYWWGEKKNGVWEFTESESKTIVKCQAPAHPFYIRWINNLGGYDYWMFECNQKKSLSLEENEYYETTDGVLHTLKKVGKKTITASTGIVSIEELEILSEIPYSPDIRWWDEKDKSWRPIQIEEANPEWYTNQSTGQIEITFVLPTPVINK